MNTFRSFYILIILVIIFCQTVYPDPFFRNAKTLEIFEISESIKVDGQIEDNAWQKLKFADNFTVYPKRNKSKFDTKFKLACDANSLCILIQLENFKVSKELVEKDTSNVNYFEFYIMPDMNNKKFIQVSINEYG